jgi:hypothetical protein
VFALRMTISCCRETAHPPLEGSIVDPWRRCASASSAIATLSSGTLRSLRVSPTFDSVQMSHLVGSHCQGLTPLR